MTMNIRGLFMSDMKFSFENGEEIFEVIVGNGELKTFSRDELTRTGRNVDILNVISKLTYDEGYADEIGLQSAT